MMNWYLKLLLKRRKKFNLIEVETDLRYIGLFKREALYADEKPMRKRLKELQAKAGTEGQVLSEQEESEVSMLVDKIADSQSTKSEHEKLLALQRDLGNYVRMLG